MEKAQVLLIMLAMAPFHSGVSIQAVKSTFKNNTTLSVIQLNSNLFKLEESIERDSFSVMPSKKTKDAQQTSKQVKMETKDV